MKNEELRSQLASCTTNFTRLMLSTCNNASYLQTLADEIQALLKRDEIQRHHYTSLSERLNDAVAELEASHPQITLLMRQTIDSLAYLGI